MFILLQYLLPQHTLSRIVGWAARSRVRWFKNLLIRAFMRGFRPDLSDAVETDPLAYDSFNAFFTRALRPGARPLADPAASILCPVDGTVSELGPITGERLIQAKGRDYTLLDLLAGNREWVARFAGGEFATIYLAPYNYHRIHMPAAGTVKETWYVPGRLFSVNRQTADSVPRLFARNERLVCLFDGAAGPFAVILVGALNVGSMDTVWHGNVAPRRPRHLQCVQPRDTLVSARQPAGAELGRFNMGSTVILLFPPAACCWRSDLRAGSIVRMGESLGIRQAADATSAP
jgi:phosphatidylserine decarboxylase